MVKLYIKNNLLTVFQKLYLHVITRLLSVSVEDILSGVVPVSQHDSIFKARLQLIVLCPVFLESLSSSLAPAAMLGTLLQPGHVLAMLLGVSDDSVTIQHRTGSRESCL